MTHTNLAERSLLELRALLDSLPTTRDKSVLMRSVFDPSKTEIARREEFQVVSARVQLFETERPVRGGELAECALDNRPSNVPMNAESIPSRTDFSDT